MKTLNFEKEKNEFITKYNDTTNKFITNNNKITNIIYNHYNKNIKNDEITLLYQLHKEYFKTYKMRGFHGEVEAAVKISGYDFVKNNKDKCKISYDGK